MTSVVQAPLTYSTSVPRHHVHRAAICEVFLTDILCNSYPSFSVGLQLPRVHSFYSDHDLDRRLYDPMLLLEAFRQASILISHRHVDAPMDSKFVFNSGSLHVASVDALTMGDRPTDGVIDAVIVADKRRGADVVGITLEMTMTLAGTFAATMDMTIQWMPPTAWTKLRARGREVLPLDPPRPYPTQHRVAAREVGVAVVPEKFRADMTFREDRLAQVSLSRLKQLGSKTIGTECYSLSASCGCGPQLGVDSSQPGGSVHLSKLSRSTKGLPRRTPRRRSDLWRCIADQGFP